MFEHEVRGDWVGTRRGIDGVRVDAQLDGFTVIDHRSIALLVVRPFEVDDCRSAVAERAFKIALSSQLNGHCFAGDGQYPVVVEVGLGADDRDAAVSERGEQMNQRCGCGGPDRVFTCQLPRQEQLGSEPWD